MIRSVLATFIGVICFVTVSGQNGNFNLQVFYKPSLIAIISKSAKMGVILDSSSRLIVVLNGNRSSIIVADISEQVRYYLKNEPDIHKSIWSNFEDYFKKLPSLQPLLKTGQEKGQESQLGALKESVRGDLEEVFNSLGGSSTMPEELALLTKFIERLRGPLSLVYSKTGSFRTIIGVDRFTEVNLAVAKLLSYSEGKLTPENVKFTTSQIFTTCGADAFQKILFQVGARFDLTKVFDELFASPEKVVSLLINATGGSHVGLDGLITILVNYVEVFNGTSSINQLILSILNHTVQPALSLSSFVQRMLTVVERQQRLFRNGDKFSIYVPILRGLITKDYTSNNIGLSDIITFLPTRARSSRNPLFTLVKLLSSFYPASTVPHFFGSTLKQFNQTLGGGSTPENSTSEVFYKPSLLAIINKSTKMAVIIDYSSRLIAVLNKKRSFIIIVVDTSEQVRYYLKNETDTENSIWSNFEDYFQKVPSLQSFLKFGQEKGEKSKLDTLEEPVRGDLEEVFNNLGGSSSMTEERSFQIELVEYLRGPLTVVYKGSGSFRIASGVDAFTKVNKAVAELLSDS